MEELPSSVVANNPFVVKLKTINKYNDTITTSIHSTMESVSGVSWVHKLFEVLGGLYMVRTDCVLGGPDTITHTTNDQVVFKNFNAGLVSLSFYYNIDHIN